MTALTKHSRFMANNFLGDDVIVSATSSATGFPVSNIYNPDRTKVWKAAGYFRITATNGTFRFNDGSARTAVVPVGNYTPATLATAIAAAAVASGATATVVASAVSTAPYIWRLTFNISVSLTLSNSTNAIWDTLGFVGSSDRSGLVFNADAARAHTYEQLTFNLGVARVPSFIGIIGLISEVFKVTTAATVTLMASNVDSWDSPAVSMTLARTDFGLKSFIDSVAPEYEFFAVRFVDRENPLGSAGIKVSYVYLGDHVTMTTSNVGLGFTKTQPDSSTIQRSDYGNRWSRRRLKGLRFSGLAIGNMLASERRIIEQTLFDVGLAGSFFVSLDPATEVTTTIDEQTFFAYLDGDPSIAHVIRDVYSVSFNLQECA